MLNDLHGQARLALGREPTEAEWGRLSSANSLADLRMRLAEFPEVHLDPAVRRAFELAQQRRLRSGPLPIQTEVSAYDLERLFVSVEAAWERLGRDDPHWSVVTSEAFRADKIEQAEAEFYASGKAEVDIYLNFLRRAGLDPSDTKTLLEVGCGVGRMTQYLAGCAGHVVGVDISGPHLALAAKAMDERNIRNVSLRKVETVRAYDDLSAFDALFSFIVLQHSPPPVQVHILRTLLGRLQPGGHAYFQIITHIDGYSFDVEHYLRDTKGEMEMHVVPQKAVLALFRDFEVLEVVNDGSGGDHRFESTRVLARKR